MTVPPVHVVSHQCGGMVVVLSCVFHLKVVQIALKIKDCCYIIMHIVNRVPVQRPRQLVIYLNLNIVGSEKLIALD